MPIKFIRGDITKIKCDAIVNAANNTLLGGGGVDGAIHRAAGRQLLEECRQLGGCETGDAKITHGYDLPSKYVIHTVGPIYRDGKHNEEELLRSCYRKSLEIATENNCESIAFPLISAGAYGYPKQEAFSVAVSEIRKFIEITDIEVFIVLFNGKVNAIDGETHRAIDAYINDGGKESPNRSKYLNAKSALFSAERCEPQACVCKESAFIFDEEGETFSQMLLRLIDESGMKDSECYKKANIDRKLFSKIRSDKYYHPKKSTVLAFAVALCLDEYETDELLRSAGFALSDGVKSDLIIKYFIKNRIFDVIEINRALFEYGYENCLLGT